MPNAQSRIPTHYAPAPCGSVTRIARKDLEKYHLRDARAIRASFSLILGLVKKLVELHGGTITAFSEGLGKGSEFVVRLPMAVDQSGKISTVQKVSSSAPSKKARVLIVDDHIDAAATLKIFLKMDGHNVVVANDGESAIQAAQEHQPEVALLDIGLPNKDGYQVARELRGKLPSIKLIAISGWGQEEYKRRSVEAGFNHHLVKPIDVEELRQLLDS